MQRYAQIHERARSISQLGNVISAMRGVAAARAQQSRQQLKNVQKYADIVAEAISQVLAIAPADKLARNNHAGRAALILFCAEHGFAGAFSEKIYAGAGSDLAGNMLLIVGTRGLRLAHARGLAPTWSTPLMSQLANAAALADRIVAELYRHLHAGEVDRVDVVYARPRAQQEAEIIRQRILPLDYSRFATTSKALPPILNLPAELLLRRLAGEYLFAQLNEAIVHTFAAENLARLQTMSAAHENISRRIDSLSQEERQARQTEITAEIVELAAGAEGLI